MGFEVPQERRPAEKEGVEAEPAGFEVGSIVVVERGDQKQLEGGWIIAHINPNGYARVLKDEGGNSVRKVYHISALAEIRNRARMAGFDEWKK